MCKTPRHILTTRRSLEQTHAFGLIEGRDQRLAVDTSHGFEQLELEVVADHRGEGQDALGLGGDTLHPPLEHGSHRLWDVDVVEVEIASPLFTDVEQPA